MTLGEFRRSRPTDYAICLRAARADDSGEAFSVREVRAVRRFLRDEQREASRQLDAARAKVHATAAELVRVREREAKLEEETRAEDYAHLDATSDDPHWHELRRVERELARERIVMMNEALGLPADAGINDDASDDSTTFTSPNGATLTIHRPKL